ncbi:MAG: FixH family protein [bacterium]
MKMNWGKGIALTYILFIVVVLIMVAFSFTKEVNLVTDDYYEKEIKYQEQIEKLENTEQLAEKPEIKIVNRQIEVIFPSVFNPFDVSGDIHFYRPADNKNDRTVELNLDGNSIQKIPIENMARGLWKIKIDWLAKDKKYYLEKIVIIN